MSIAENLTSNQDRVQEEIIKMQNAIAKCETGREMLDHSQNLALSDEMMALMYIIGNEEIPEEERVVLAQYMGDALKTKPQTGLIEYAKYLEDAAAKEDYEDRKDYYESLAYASRELHESDIYQEYIKTYLAFEADESPEAVEARKITEESQKMIRKLSTN